jgi:hypothetical protein
MNHPFPLVGGEGEVAAIAAITARPARLRIFNRGGRNLLGGARGHCEQKNEQRKWNRFITALHGTALAHLSAKHFEFLPGDCLESREAPNHGVAGGGASLSGVIFA